MRISGIRLGKRSDPGALTVGARLPEARDADHDQAGMNRLQGVVTEAPFFEGAGTIVLDHDVVLGYETFYNLNAEGRSQVECDGFLVAVDDFVIQTYAIFVFAPEAHFVALAGLLDFQYLRAKVRKKH